jgi:hypothetical protein
VLRALAAADALQVEGAFAARVTSFAADEPSPKPEAPPAYSQTKRTKASKNRTRTPTIDKSVPTLPEPRRHRAFKSTGPTTDAGKQRSRRNAVRHGLTAETVITTLEDEEDYKKFELSVTSGFDAATAIERELVLRLASLLWRLRRATAIDTGLLQLQSEIIARREVADLRPQIALLALKGALGALLGHQFDEKFFDQCRERSVALGGLGAGSPVGLVIH